MLSTALVHIRRQWMGALALFLVLSGGIAYAQGTIGSEEIIDNSLQSVDFKNNQVKSADVRDDTLASGGLGGQDIAPDALTGDDVVESSLVGVMRYGSTIPSGVTVKGAWATSGANLFAGAVSFPVPTSQDLVSADVNFAANDPVGTDDDPACTGDYVFPSAPAGKVCLYSAALTSGYTARGATDGGGQGADESAGFHVEGTTATGGARGVWAYTAP